MAVFYALIVSLFVYREIGVKDLWSILLSSARTSAMVMFVVASGILFSFVLSSERIPTKVSAALLESNLSPLMFLIMINVLLLIVGMFMETSSAILILAPVLLPVALALGIDPIHLGIIMVLNLEIGMMTPPMGLNLFVASGLTGKNIIDVAKAAAPSVGVLLIALILVTFIPQIALFPLGR